MLTFFRRGISCSTNLPRTSTQSCARQPRQVIKGQCHEILNSLVLKGQCHESFESLSRKRKVLRDFASQVVKEQCHKILNL